MADTQVPKMHSWIVNMVSYLNMLARSIFLTAVRLLGKFKGQKIAKVGQIEDPKYKIVHCEAKRDSKVSKIYSWYVKLICYLKKATRSIFLTTIRLYELKRTKKEQKIGPLNSQKHKIAHYEAKWYFKVRKMHSWLVKLVFYLNKSARSIFLTAVRL